MPAAWQLSREFDGAKFDANRRRVAAMYKAMFDKVGLPLDGKVLAMAEQHGAPAELWRFRTQCVGARHWALEVMHTTRNIACQSNYSQLT